MVPTTEYLGAIKSYNKSKGYGFLACEELAQMYHGRDVFVHQRVVEDFLRRHPDPTTNLFHLAGKNNGGSAAHHGSGGVLTGGSAASSSTAPDNLTGILVRFTIQEQGGQPKALEIRGIAKGKFLMQEMIISTLTSYDPPADLRIPGYCTLSADIKNIGTMDLGVPQEELTNLVSQPQIGDSFVFDLHRMAELPPPYGSMVPRDLERLDVHTRICNFMHRNGSLGNTAVPYYAELRSLLGIDASPRHTEDEARGSVSEAVVDSIAPDHPTSYASAERRSVSGSAAATPSHTYAQISNGAIPELSNEALGATITKTSSAGSSSQIPRQSRVNAEPRFYGQIDANGYPDSQFGHDVEYINDGKWYQGSLKQYKDDKHYGFATSPELDKEQLFETGRDVFVRNLVGFKVGETIQFQVVDVDGKPQAANVDEIAGARYVGVIKSFDPGKAFGFIRCEELQDVHPGDVFLQGAAYPDAFARDFPVGSAVEFCLWINLNNKPQALRLRPPSEKQRFFGSIKSFSEAKQYGFIESSEAARKYGGSDVYLAGTQFPGFAVGDRVSFEVLPRKGKATAENLALLTDAGEGNFAEGKDGDDRKRHYGSIKSCNATKGFGFIDCEPLKKKFNMDTFVNAQQLVGMQVGDRVSFVVSFKDLQPQATQVRRDTDIPKGRVSTQSSRSTSQPSGTTADGDAPGGGTSSSQLNGDHRQGATSSGTTPRNENSTNSRSTAEFGLVPDGVVPDGVDPAAAPTGAGAPNYTHSQQPPKRSSTSSSSASRSDGSVSVPTVLKRPQSNGDEPFSFAPSSAAPVGNSETSQHNHNQVVAPEQFDHLHAGVAGDGSAASYGVGGHGHGLAQQQATDFLGSVPDEAPFSDRGPPLDGSEAADKALYDLLASKLQEATLNVGNVVGEAGHTTSSKTPTPQSRTNNDTPKFQPEKRVGDHELPTSNAVSASNSRRVSNVETVLSITKQQEQAVGEPVRDTKDPSRRASSTMSKKKNPVDLQGSNTPLSTTGPEDSSSRALELPTPTKDKDGDAGLDQQQKQDELQVDKTTTTADQSHKSADEVVNSSCTVDANKKHQREKSPTSNAAEAASPSKVDETTTTGMASSLTTEEPNNITSKESWGLTMISEEQQKKLDKKLCRLCGSHNPNLTEIEEFLQLGASPNAEDVSGFRPLMLCAMNITQTTCWQKIELLLEYGADLETPTRTHSSVLAWLKERIGDDFSFQVSKLHHAITTGGDRPREEHGYLFQDNNELND
ncbi:unnamed protein product [Amoebophrya sp. A25]|nr:unnamed protein product [Amoebophrya sp. A25]|eukprot:GSA25T00027311001.1